MAIIVLGIDPGLALMGYGVIEEDRGKMSRLVSGCVSTPKDTTTSSRLHMLYNGLTGVIKEYMPTVLVMEKLFFNRNVTTALKVGEARGVVLLAAEQNSMKIVEFTPLQIKQAVCGYGRATKDQVKNMVCMQMGVANSFANDDESDALAVAMCYLFQRKWHDAVERVTDK